ncbi:MAG TPA: secondary thiamine-phosphate synthase enzyme YjbQ [Thermoleophilia bacterium]|nr:secondary thiamine-phosphate synthase enzyme YjbQ [Thermoleophilia bacterium]
MISLSIETDTRVALLDVTDLVANALGTSGLREGAALVYCPHTTAGLTINEHADPTVRRDIAMALERLVPDDLPFAHLEGNSDAHVKASLVGASVLVPVEGGRPALGTWQGIFFCEFDGPRRRRLLVQPLPAPRP